MQTGKTNHSRSTIYLRWEPSALLAEFWGFTYRFWSRHVWKKIYII